MTSRRLPHAALLLLLALAAAPAAHAVEPLRQHDVVLLEKDAIFTQRVEGGPDAMAAYVKALGAATTETMRAHPSQLPTAGFIVIAVRPGGLTHTWFDFKPALADATATALAQAVEATPALAVKGGDIVFALRVSLWSDKPPKADVPVPQEWKDAAKDMHPKPDVDTLVDRVWPR